MEESEFLQRLADDPVFFCKVIIGITPYKYQEDILLTKSKRIVAVCGRQTGKSTIISVKVVHFAFSTPNKTILIISKGLRQSMIMFSIVSRMILDNPLLAGSVKRITQTQIWLSNGSTIIALPCSTTGANLRGYTAHMVVMDEAAFMPETVITQVIFPMLATTNGIAIMLSTPWGRLHIFYRAYCDPHYWVLKVKSKDCPKISQEFLDEQRNLIGDLRYRIEYEAEFIEDANALYTQDMIRTCLDKWDDTLHELWTDADIEQFTTKIRGTFVLGCDLGKRMDYSVIMVLKREHIEIINEKTGRPDKIECWRPVYIKQFPLKTPIPMVMNKIRWLNGKLSLNYGCIDSTGIGDAPVEELSLDIATMEGVPLYAAKTKHQVAQYCYLQVERGKLALPNEKELVSQMNEQCFGYSAVKQKIETEEKGIMVYWHPEGRHDDQLWALQMGMYATRNVR